MSDQNNWNRMVSILKEIFTTEYKSTQAIKTIFCLRLSEYCKIIPWLHLEDYSTTFTMSLANNFQQNQKKLPVVKNTSFHFLFKLPIRYNSFHFQMARRFCQQIIIIITSVVIREFLDRSKDLSRVNPWRAVPRDEIFSLYAPGSERDFTSSTQGIIQQISYNFC